MKLFSAFAASTLLERDRQTITRALRSTPPDGKERGAPRWKMSTIVDALEAHGRANGNGTNAGADPGLAAAYAEFDVKFAAMEAAPTLERRRKLARKLGPLVSSIDHQLRAHGRAIGVGDELADYRAQEIWRLTLLGFEKPCLWSRSECHQYLDAA
jgi:hypothetical protein